MKLLLSIIIGLIFNVPVSAQESEKGTHRIALGIGHTQTPEGRKAGKTEWIALPSWSLDYDYRFAGKWAIGLQSDMVLEAFVIETSDGENLERTRPISVVPALLYKPYRYITLIAGAGQEFSTEQNLFLTRLAAECAFPLPKSWEAGIAVIWDDKWQYYNSFNLTLSFSKILGR